MAGGVPKRDDSTAKTSTFVLSFWSGCKWAGRFACVPWGGKGGGGGTSPWWAAGGGGERFGHCKKMQMLLQAVGHHTKAKLFEPRAMPLAYPLHGMAWDRVERGRG